MPRINPYQESLNSGEFSPRMASRVSFEKYPNACSLLENMIPLLQGGAARRPGTRFVAPVKDSQQRGRLIPFEFSTEQAYVVEAGDAYFRFFRNQGRIAVPGTVASITNGTFDADIAGWTDLSTGGTAAIAQEVLGQNEEGTFERPNSGTQAIGDGIASRANVGQRFPNSVAGTVSRVRLEVTAATVPFNAVASLWTDNAGSPGTQLGSNSVTVNLNGAGVFTFTWSSNAPTLADDTTYWIVITDQDAGSGNVTIRLSAALGAAFGFGQNDIITSISDTLTAEGRIGATVDIATANGALALIGDADQTAVAEQEVPVTPGVEHVLRYRVIGVTGDSIKLRVGTASGAVDLVEDFPSFPGTHIVAFTSEVTPVFIQFRNGRNKTVHIDNIDLQDDAPLELPTPYATADLPQIKWAQSADVMYIAHPNYPIHRLSRTGDTSWSLEVVPWLDGPYQDENTDETVKIDASAADGTGITFTATGGAPFNATDVGRLLRLKVGANDYGYAVITDFESGSQVTGDILRTLTAHTETETETWALGAWSETTGYPSTVNFFEQRFAAANTAAQRQTFWLSQSADIENFRPDSFEENVVEVQDDDALDFTIAATKVNAIQWLLPGQQLFIGTTGGEWVARSEGPVLTPNDIDVDQFTSHGAADTSAVRVGFESLFVQRARRKLRSMSFDFNIDSFRAPDMTILANHVSRSGLREIQFQEEPDNLLWCVREDGVLATLTFLREQNVVGWSRQVLGGTYDEGPAQVESVAIIPGNKAGGSEERDEVWVLVKRSVNGATLRSIEFFEKAFEGPRREDFEDDAAFDAAVIQAQKQAFYVDSGLSGSFAPAKTTITGLDHLEGETVAILADGALRPNQVVSGGQIELASPAAEVSVGLPYEHRYKSLKLAAGAQAGTAVGKTKRVHAVTLLLLDALGGRAGPAPERMEPLIFREVQDAMDSAVPLFTGEHRIAFDGRHRRDPRIEIRGSAPLPFTLLALAPEMTTRDLV